MQPNEKSGAVPGADMQAYPQRWPALAIMMVANFMNLLDVTIVNVALPSLQHDLGADSSEIEWIVAGYVLTFALGLLPFGRLGDLKGKRQVFLVGVVAFTAASALCGLASGTEMLIAARFVQGAAGAIMTPQVLAIAQVMFPPKERAAAFSLFGLSAGLASVSGPIIGGWLIGMNLFDLGWRPIFLINVPVGIITVLVARRLIPVIPARPGLRNDWGGIALAGVTIFCVIFPLIEGRGFGWPAWMIAMLVLALPGALAFYAWERRQRRLDGPELLPLSLMSNRNYAIGAVMTAIFFSAVPGFFLSFAMFLQQGFGLTALQSGLTTMPFSLGVLVASIVSGRIGTIGPRIRMIAGLLLISVGMFGLRQSVIGLGEAVEGGAMLVFLGLAGLGLGIAIAPMFQVVLSSVAPHDAGSASGALQAIQQVGSAFGIAIVSEIFFSHLESGLVAGNGPHAVYRESMAMAIVYSLAAYAIVLAATALLKPRHLADPVVASVLHD